MKTQKKDQKTGTPATGSKAQKEMKGEDLKKVKGGSGLLSGGNDLSNMIGGTVGITNSSSGSNGSDSYSSNDSHSVDLGLGNILNNTNF